LQDGGRAGPSWATGCLCRVITTVAARLGFRHGSGELAFQLLNRHLFHHHNHGRKGL